MRDLEAENKMLRNQIEGLEEKVRALGGSPDLQVLDIYRRIFKIGNMEARLLHLLYKRQLATHEAIHCTFWGDDVVDCPAKNVQVRKHHLKTALAKHKIKIEVYWGVGYYMTREDKDKVKKLYDNATGETQ